MTIHFDKYQGAGNDFILLDNRSGEFSSLGKKEIFMLCDRHFGVGADGLILLNTHPEADFEMKYFNANGKEGTMCANGGRCVTAFAKQIGLIEKEATIMAIDGLHHAEILKDDWIALQMQDVSKVDFGYDYAILDTGSPQYVKFTEFLGDVDVVREGRKIREQKEFMPDGINVNFLEYGTNALEVRTYERGVEDETLACGTGVVACALVVSGNQSRHYKVPVSVKGGDLEVQFHKIDQQNYQKIRLLGPVGKVFEGHIELNEQWRKRLSMIEHLIGKVK